MIESSVVEKLDRVRTRIESLKESEAKRQGKLEQILKTLKTQFKVDDLDEAKVLLENLKKDQEVMENSIELITDSLQKVIDDATGIS